MPPPRTTRLRELRAWLIGLGVIALFIGGLAAVGAFDEAGRPRRIMAAGETAHSARWDITLEGVELRDRDDNGYPTAPFVRYTFTLTNRSDESLTGPARGVLVVATPTTQVVGEREALVWKGAGRAGDFGPDLPQRVWTDVKVEGPLWEDGAPAKALVQDEAEQGSSLGIEYGWQVTYVVGRYDVPCVDRRGEQ